MMNCEKCGYQLNNWNAYCPNCGTEAPETIAAKPTAVSSTVSSGAGVTTPFLRLSMACWIILGVFSVIRFQTIDRIFFGGRSASFLTLSFNWVIGLANIICAVALIAAVYLFMKKSRIEFTVLAMGFYIIVDLAKLFYGHSLIATGRAVFHDPLNQSFWDIFRNWRAWGINFPYALVVILFFALMGAVVIAFFVFFRQQGNMRSLFKISLVCTVAWLIAALVAAPLLSMNMFGARGAFLMPIDSEMIRDLMFFCGAAFLALHMAEKAK